jgi:hypothetical protein
MINDAGKHEVKKLLGDGCNRAVLVPLPVSRFRSSQTLAACPEARAGFQGVLTTFMSPIVPPSPQHVPRGSGKEAATSLGSGCLGQGYQRLERDY